MFFTWLKDLFKIGYTGDLSLHRVHSTKYDDLCK